MPNQDSHKTQLYGPISKTPYPKNTQNSPNLKSKITTLLQPNSWNIKTIPNSVSAHSFTWHPTFPLESRFNQNSTISKTPYYQKDEKQHQILTLHAHLNQETQNSHNPKSKITTFPTTQFLKYQNHHNKSRIHISVLKIFEKGGILEYPKRKTFGYIFQD